MWTLIKWCYLKKSKVCPLSSSWNSTTTSCHIDLKLHIEVLLSQSLLCKSRPSEACLPAACLLDPFLNVFLLFFTLPHMQIPAVVTHRLSPAMVHPTRARCAVTSLGLCLRCLTGCLPIAKHSDSQQGSALPLGGRTSLYSSSVPGFQFQIPVVRLHSLLFQVKLKLGDGFRSHRERWELVSEISSTLFS